eukprot:jgi/Chlat1/764/Chrsp104S01239
MLAVAGVTAAAGALAGEKRLRVARDGGEAEHLEEEDAEQQAGSEDEMMGSCPRLSDQEEYEAIDKDLACPICMGEMRDAFMTSCGHSFCYGCIVQHLKSRSNCPCCAQFISQDHLFPNFLLNKLLKKTKLSSGGSKALSPAQQLRHALASVRPLLQLLLAYRVLLWDAYSVPTQGSDISSDEIEALVGLLQERRKVMEAQDAESSLDLVMDFMQRSRAHKAQLLAELRADLDCLEIDLRAISCNQASTTAPATSDQQSFPHSSSLVQSNLLFSVPPSPKASQPVSGVRWPGSQSASKTAHSNWGAVSPVLQSRKHTPIPAIPAPTNRSMDSATVAKKRRVFSQFEDLQQAYLRARRRRRAAEPTVASRGVDQGWPDVGGAEPGSLVGPHTTVRIDASAGAPAATDATGLAEFRRTLAAVTRYGRMQVMAELRHNDLFHSNIVSSIEFDKDDELFATAGVSKRIKVFDFASLVGDCQSQTPVTEISCRSKLSCLSWNKAEKTHLASSDYEGVVTLWDVATSQSVIEFEEHEKRVWSVDFSRTEPNLLVSGSDDGKVKVWSVKQENSVLNIDTKANICCVKYNPGSSHHIAVGSADHHIHSYDLRCTREPLYVFAGHRKAVSYVKFISSTELASASTDSTLRLWDVRENYLVRTLKGHTNEKNFVGLGANSDYIACGSETNEVFVYYKAMSKPTCTHRFQSSSDSDAEVEDDSSQFISAVCWKSDSPMMLAANSQGIIKVLSLAP